MRCSINLQVYHPITSLILTSFFNLAICHNACYTAYVACEWNSMKHRVFMYNVSLRTQFLIHVHISPGILNDDNDRYAPYTFFFYRNISQHQRFQEGRHISVGLSL